MRKHKTYTLQVKKWNLMIKKTKKRKEIGQDQENLKLNQKVLKKKLKEEKRAN